MSAEAIMRARGEARSGTTTTNKYKHEDGHEDGHEHEHEHEHEH